MVGLGRMGGNMAERLRAAGHEVVGYDAFSDAPRWRPSPTLAGGSTQPAVVWVMVPAGDPTEDVVGELAGLLAPGDVVIDGGNSNWHDTLRRGGTLAGARHRLHGRRHQRRRVGPREGYCLMVGGDRSTSPRPSPSSTRSAGRGRLRARRPVGAGHFTKMVHNGIEYGLMQAYAEGYELLDARASTSTCRRARRRGGEGTVVRSWLLDLLVRGPGADTRARRASPASPRTPARAAGPCKRRSSVGVAAPVITAALFARFVSRQDDSLAMKVIAALRNQFGGHAVLPETDKEATPKDRGTSYERASRRRESSPAERPWEREYASTARAARR